MVPAESLLCSQRAWRAGCGASPRCFRRERILTGKRFASDLETLGHRQPLAHIMVGLALLIVLFLHKPASLARVQQRTWMFSSSRRARVCFATCCTHKRVRFVMIRVTLWATQSTGAALAAAKSTTVVRSIRKSIGSSSTNMSARVSTLASLQRHVQQKLVRDRSHLHRHSLEMEQMLRCTMRNVLLAPYRASTMAQHARPRVE